MRRSQGANSLLLISRQFPIELEGILFYQYIYVDSGNFPRSQRVVSLYNNVEPVKTVVAARNPQMLLMNAGRLGRLSCLDSNIACAFILPLECI